MEKIRLYIGIFILLPTILLGPPRAQAEVVGALMPTTKIPHYVAAHNAFLEELAKLGFPADKVEIVLQWPAPSVMAWKNSIRRFFSLDVAVILTYGAATTLAVIDEKNPVSVVFCSAFDPEAVGISGGNVTGTNTKVPIQTLVKHLKTITNFTKLAIVFNKEEKDSVQQADAVAALASQLDFKAFKFDVKEEDEDYTIPAEANAIFMTTASPTMRQKNLKTIIAQAHEKKIPTAALLSGTAELGVLISLSANPVVEGKKAAKMVAEVLRGKRAGSIPVDNSPEIELTINLKEADELGLKVPADLTSSAKTIK